MCQIGALRQIVYILAFVKVIMGVLIMYVGGTFVSSLPIHLAFSIDFISMGGGIIVLGLLSFLLSFPLVYGVQKHNRFILAVSFLFDTIFMGQLISLGFRVGQYTYPQFEKELQLDCLLVRPLAHSDDECRAFFESDRTAGIRLLWSYLHSIAADPVQFQVMSTIQIAETCCGFFPAMQANDPTTGCREIPGSLPQGHSQSYIPSVYTQMKLKCGEYPGYYMETSTCTSFFDETVIPKIVGGCNYDLGVGPCLEAAVTDETLGCGSSVEDYAVSLISSNGVLLIGSTFANLLAMLLVCCMWWKRKAEDVFPNFLREAKVGDKIEYSKVRDQFKLEPQEHYLQLHGFAPGDKHTTSNAAVKYAKQEEFKAQGEDGGLEAQISEPKESVDGS